MALKRTRVTLAVDVIWDASLTEEDVIRDFKRKVAEVSGPSGAKSDEPHWFAADIHVSRISPVPLDGFRFTEGEVS